MLFDHKYPGTDLHEIDLAYMLAQVQQIKEQIDTLYNNGIVKFADPVEWAINRNYTAGIIVKDAGTSNYYIAKQLVPSGIQLYNTEYWQSLGLMETADYSGEIARLDAEIAVVSTTANQAGQDAQAAGSAAQAAQTAANAAQTTAQSAQTTAESVAGIANSALTTATNAQTAASSAQTTAQAAQTTAENIAGTANAALDAAQSAQTSAQSAQTAAQNAQATADGVAGTANTALSTAQDAATTATSAQATANSIAGTANTALSTAQAAQSAAGSAQTAAQNAQTTANGKVSKSGDTMTGILHMSNKGINFDSSLIDKTTTPASVVNSEPLLYKGVNDQSLGQIRFRHKTDGTLEMRLITQGQNGSNELDIQVQSDGTPSIAVTDPVAWQKAIACATDSDINALTALYNATVKAVSTESSTLSDVIAKFTAIGDIKAVATSQAFNNTILSDNTQGFIIGNRYATNRITVILKTRNNMYQGYIDISNNSLIWHKITTGNQNTYTET